MMITAHLKIAANEAERGALLGSLARPPAHQRLIVEVAGGGWLENELALT